MVFAAALALLLSSPTEHASPIRVETLARERPDGPVHARIARVDLTDPRVSFVVTGPLDRHEGDPPRAGVAATRRARTRLSSSTRRTTDAARASCAQLSPERVTSTAGAPRQCGTASRAQRPAASSTARATAAFGRWRTTSAFGSVRLRPGSPGALVCPRNQPS